MSNTRKDVRTLTDVFPSVSIDKIPGISNIVNECLCYDIDKEDAPSVTRYPFSGRYIEVIFKNDTSLEKATAAESEIMKYLEKLIGQKLTCTCSARMSDCKKVLYRIEYEYCDPESKCKTDV